MNTEERKDAPSDKGREEVVDPEPGGKRNWVDQYYEELNHALHRFNYFLVAISFMFVAFVTLITSCKSDELNWIIILVASTGIALSFYFFQINYQQTRVARLIRERRRNIPIDKDDASLDTIRWFRHDSFVDAIKYYRLSHVARELPASHTWAIPFLFLVIWIVSLLGWCITGI